MALTSHKRFETNRTGWLSVTVPFRVTFIGLVNLTFGSKATSGAVVSTVTLVGLVPPCAALRRVAGRVRGPGEEAAVGTLRQVHAEAVIAASSRVRGADADVVRGRDAQCHGRIVRDVVTL